jgi:DNA end-binding protein Ku
MRAIWKGHIRFSLVTIPIRLYTAVESGYSIHFNQLSRTSKNPVTYQKKDKITGEPLKNEDIIKGYQYEPGQYVIMGEEDLNKVKLKSTKVIEIEGFVDASEVHPTLYDTPYFIGPDGDVTGKTYGLLRQTLQETNKVGVGRVILRDKENLVLLRPQENSLIMYKLRYPDEVRNVADIPQLDKAGDIDKSQLKLAKTLVDSMSSNFEEIDKTDRYHQAVMDIIKAKIEGKEIVAFEEEEMPAVDIMTALKQSIEQAKSERKPMKRATGKATQKSEKEPAGKKQKTG